MPIRESSGAASYVINSGMIYAPGDWIAHRLPETSIDLGNGLRSVDDLIHALKTFAVFIPSSGLPDDMKEEATGILKSAVVQLICLRQTKGKEDPS